MGGEGSWTFICTRSNLVPDFSSRFSDLTSSVGSKGPVPEVSAGNRMLSRRIQNRWVSDSTEKVLFFWNDFLFDFLALRELANGILPKMFSPMFPCELKRSVKSTQDIHHICYSWILKLKMLAHFFPSKSTKQVLYTVTPSLRKFNTFNNKILDRSSSVTMCQIYTFLRNLKKNNR